MGKTLPALAQKAAPMKGGGATSDEVFQAVLAELEDFVGWPSAYSEEGLLEPYRQQIAHGVVRRAFAGRPGQQD